MMAKKQRNLRDGTGPFKDSFQERIVGFGRRIERGEECPENNVKKGKIILKILKQRGKSNRVVDVSREARLPGKRISRTGNIYFETRKNRSDALGKKV